MGQRGVSLVELLIALGIAAALLAGAESLVGAAMREKAKAVEVELAAELRFARHLAVQKREPVEVVFDLASSSLKTELVKSRVLFREYQFARRGVIVESLSSGEKIIFYPSGRVATPTTITIRRDSGEVRRLTVSITGRVAAS